MNCQVLELPEFDELRAQDSLPDPFLGLNGQRITTRAQWRCRRQEILKVAERFIYGHEPPPPERVTGSVSESNITVDVQNQGRSASFGARLTLPQNASGPVPAVIAYGGSVFQTAMLEEGVAIIDYDTSAVGDEKTGITSPDNTRGPKQGAFYTVNPDHADTGMLMAWAWGLSRIIDVLEAWGAPIIDPTRIAVTGCSRNGKGAFIAGAFDERVALTIPLEAGMGGVAAFRRVVQEQGAESPRNALQYRPWAGDAFTQFAPSAAAAVALQARLPIDTHEIIGAIAPRGLLVMGNPNIAHLAPHSELVSVLAGAEIYAALGVKENISYISNTSIDDHCVPRPDFLPLLRQNLRKFLKGDPNASTGTINPHPRLTAELGPHIDWQTPSLE